VRTRPPSLASLAQARQAWVRRLRPLAGRYLEVREAQGGALRERLAEARAAVLEAPELALGSAWSALELEADPRAVTAESAEACCVAGLAFARLGQVPAGQVLLRLGRHEATQLPALPLPGQLAALTAAPQALAAAGRLERADAYARRAAAQLVERREPVAALALTLQASALCRATGRPLLAVGWAEAAGRQLGSGLTAAASERVLVWLGLCFFDADDEPRRREAEAGLTERGTRDGSVAPYQHWALARLEALEGNGFRAVHELRQATRLLAREAAVVEHRLATLDLAALQLHQGHASEAVRLAQTVLPELAGPTRRALTREDDLAAQARIEGTPLFRRLRLTGAAPTPSTP
jgi:hypothetical protein